MAAHKDAQLVGCPTARLNACVTTHVRGAINNASSVLVYTTMYCNMKTMLSQGCLAAERCYCCCNSNTKCGVEGQGTLLHLRWWQPTLGPRPQSALTVCIPATTETTCTTNKGHPTL
jgi:hypothetical protein